VDDLSLRLAFVLEGNTQAVLFVSDIFDELNFEYKDSNLTINGTKSKIFRLNSLKSDFIHP